MVPLRFLFTNPRLHADGKSCVTLKSLPGTCTKYAKEKTAAFQPLPAGARIMRLARVFNTLAPKPLPRELHNKYIHNNSMLCNWNALC